MFALSGSMDRDTNITQKLSWRIRRNNMVFEALMRERCSKIS